MIVLYLIIGFIIAVLIVRQITRAALVALDRAVIREIMIAEEVKRNGRETPDQ